MGAKNPTNLVQIGEGCVFVDRVTGGGLEGGGAEGDAGQGYVADDLVVV